MTHCVYFACVLLFTLTIHGNGHCQEQNAVIAGTPDYVGALAQEYGKNAEVMVVSDNASLNVVQPGWRVGIKYTSLLVGTDLSGKKFTAGYFEHSQAWSLALSTIGNNDLKYTRIQAGTARKLSDSWAVGVMFGYYRATASEYFSQSLPLYQLGWHWKVADNVLVSTALENPLPLFKSGDRPAMLVRNCVSISSSDDLLFKIVLITEENRKPVVLSGVHFNTEFLSMRAGYAIGRPLLLLGAGLKYMNLIIEVATTYDFQMGMTPSLTVQLCGAKKKQKQEN